MNTGKMFVWVLLISTFTLLNDKISGETPTIQTPENQNDKHKTISDTSKKIVDNPTIDINKKEDISKWEEKHEMTPETKQRTERDMTTGTLDHMLSQVISIQEKNSAVKLKGKPERGEEANRLLNPGKKQLETKIPMAVTVRPVVGDTSEALPSSQETKDIKESYLPLYACDDLNTEPVLLEPLYKGCIHGCQMREPVKVTTLKLQSPQAYKSQLEVTWLSATKMFDLCHEDILGGEHRIKSATEYPLSEEEVKSILEDVKDHLVLNRDLIHGDYPQATCSYFQDNTESSIITRIRKSHYDLFYGPELDAYYFHLPTEQINILAWDSQYEGPTGSYRWTSPNLDRPCLLKTGEEITCVGSMKDGDNLQCATVGLLLEGPYVSSWNAGCKQMTTKDTRGTHFYRTNEAMMSYKDALQDKNPNIQSLSTAVTHIEELLCMSGCRELTLMTVANNTDMVVDTPVGIWKRKTGSGSMAVQCSAMSAGRIELLTPVCTMKGVVGIKHVGSSGMTYHWDMSQLYASSIQHPCLKDQITDVEALMKHGEDGTLVMETFIGKVELNTKTGESRLIEYKKGMVINKQRWFPNILLEQKSSDDVTMNLEILVMQQMRNLSAEYKASCQEAKGPVVLETIGGAVWMLEKDIHNCWSGLISYLWIVKMMIGLVVIWVFLYITILCVGVTRTLFLSTKFTRVPVNYRRTRKESN